MHLKSLTLKGFKSFAQTTTFAFEPGVTCVVGPNGSGKSNVVDALAWVMGEQGAKTLRGGKMDDVIFAGTTVKAPLGRAEVQLTIDNTDGALPIEYSEVTISRTLFRNGASDYAINGQGCRLVDVQELLSDSGLGREMHVIVGQGQLDSVLRATPTERRGFIEEAAGILKHRRRKEKTERKLESMRANLTRLSDLAGELRRQLKPLGAQAEVAREAVSIQAAVRDARARIIAHDVAAVRGSLTIATAELEQVRFERQLAEDAVAASRRRAEELDHTDSPEQLEAARRTALDLERVQQRVRGLALLGAQRLALLGAEDLSAEVVATTSQAELDSVNVAIDELGDAIRRADALAWDAKEAVAAATAELDVVDRTIAEQGAAVAAHDRRLAEIAARLRNAEARLAAAAADADRRAAAATGAEQRRADAASALAALPPITGGPDLSETILELETALAEDRAASDAARETLHRLEREREALAARAAALALAAERPSATGDLIAAALPGVRRRLAESIVVQGGWQTAIATALGDSAEAALADDGAAGFAALQHALEHELDAVDIVVADAPPLRDPSPLPPASPAGLIPAVAVVRAPSGVLRLLRRVLLAENLAAAAAAWPHLQEWSAEAVVVTRAGEVIGQVALRSSGGTRSRIELTAERDATLTRREAMEAEFAAAADALERSVEAVQHRQATLDDRRRELRDGEAARSAAERARAALEARVQAAEAENERLDRQRGEAAQAGATAERAVAAVRAELAEAESAPRPAFDASIREPALAALEQARERAVQTRLAVETLRERRRAEVARIRALEQRMAAERTAADEAARRAVLRRAAREDTESVLAELPELQASVDRSLLAAELERASLEQWRTEQHAALAAARRDETEQRDRLTSLTDRGHSIDMQVYEQQLSLGTLLERAAADLGLTEHDLAREYAPDGDFDRPAEERRLVVAERQLGQLGRVNPLALEEFQALEQRHAFLTEQLADLERTRTDLLTIIDDLESKMQTIFADAFADTSEAFARIFPVLFPGGSGSLELTEAEEGGVAGVELIVRPAGKKIDRLSLLSGGERSLAAIAYLMAIFQARPSPFYILDEVEAALDDANLGRLLDVVEHLRDSSQLILITHQKRTMEIADSLYGISMRQDGVSAVVGQRMSDRSSRVERASA